MKNPVRILSCAVMLLYAAFANAQEQKQPQTPEEIAALEVSQLETALKLTPAQTFYVDSILQHNYSCHFQELENLRASGMQSPESYRTVTQKWLDKTMSALKLVLDDQQYIQYLRRIGKGKEYKKGKDGLYYTKEELAKQKEADKAKK